MCVGAGDVVLDPTCGVGSVVIQGAKIAPSALFYAGDICTNTVAQCRDNVALANTAGLVHVVAMDARQLPFRDNVFTAIVCDLPFNKNHRVQGPLVEFYRRVLCELKRTARPDCRMAVLVAQVEDLVAASVGLWCIEETHPVSLGQLAAVMVLLSRCAEPVTQVPDTSL